MKRDANRIRRNWRPLLMLAIAVYLIASNLVELLHAVTFHDAYNLLFGFFLLAWGASILISPVRRVFERVLDNRLISVPLTFTVTWGAAVGMIVGGAALFIWRNKIVFGGDGYDPALNTFWGPVLCIGGFAYLYMLIRETIDTAKT